MIIVMRVRPVVNLIVSLPTIKEEKPALWSDTREYSKIHKDETYVFALSYQSHPSPIIGALSNHRPNLIIQSLAKDHFLPRVS